MSQESRNNEGLLSLLAGIGVGALIGAAVALLTAPQSGEATRTQLRGGAEDLLDTIKTSVDDLRTKLDEVRSAVRSSQEGGAAGGEGETGTVA